MGVTAPHTLHAIFFQKVFHSTLTAGIGRDAVVKGWNLFAKKNATTNSMLLSNNFSEYVSSKVRF